MNYSFIQDIEDLRNFYKEMSWSNNQTTTFIDNPTVSREISTDGAKNIQRRINFNQNYLIKTIPVLQCLIWENFSKEIESVDPSKHSIHFVAPYYKWHNKSIREISCIRNCIVHNNGIIDDDYLNSSPVKQYPKDHQINLSEQDLEVFFNEFEAGYKLVTT